MRGGAIPLLAWGAVLAVLMAINWIWTGDAIQVASFGFAVAVVWGCAVALFVAGRRRALERGAPTAPDEPEAVPTASLGAVLAGVAVGSIMFGLAFGRFLIYFGAGLLIVSLAVVLQELSAQRRQRERWRHGEQR